MSVPAGSIDAFILAAGLGTRLRPLTAHVPKPLLPIQGVPMLDIQLARLLRLPEVGRIAVNLHHLAGQVRAHVASHPAAARIALSQEDEILGTGGGIARAARILSSDPLIVVNADPPFAHPIRDVLDFHRTGRWLASIVLLRNGPLPCVLAEGDRVVSFRGGFGRAEGLTFTGMHVIARALLDRLPPAGFHDIGVTYDSLAREGRLGAFVLEQEPDCAFVDVGSPSAYLLWHRLWAEGRARGLGVPGAEGLRGIDIAGFGWVDPAAQVGEGARIARSVVLAGARIAPSARVEDSIVGPGAVVAGDVTRRLVTPDADVPVEVAS